MATAVRFSRVSKRYYLGLTRASVASRASHWLGRAWRRGSTASPPDNLFWALRDVSFDLEQGESLALVGPNGAGKSTILKLLANITVPTSGQIEVNGQLAALIELGAGFHPDLTGRENIYLNATLLGLRAKDIDARFDDIVAFAELERFIDTPIKRYSSGMTVRLGFAVASCTEPDILLVDEVLAVGDASFRQRCVQRIKSLIERGTSLIFVSHDMGLVKAVCRKAIYLEDGLMHHHGPTAEVIDIYNAVLDRRRAASLDRPERAAADASLAVEFTQVDVVGGDPCAARDLYGDQRAEVRVTYVAHRPVRGVNVAIRVYRTDGVSCFVTRTHADSFPVALERGAGVITVALEPLQLFGGTYYAIAWLTDADDANGICRASSDWFEVKNRTSGHDIHDAVFEPRRRWTHVSHGAPEA